MLTWLLNETTYESQSWSTMKLEVLTRLSKLPTDEQLAVNIELYFEEMSIRGARFRSRSEDIGKPGRLSGLSHTDHRRCFFLDQGTYI